MTTLTAPRRRQLAVLSPLSQLRAGRLYGLAARTGLSFGTVVILVGVVVLALWVPIRQLPGLGTVANVVVIGVVSDLVLGVLSTPDQPAARAGLLVGGVVLNGLAGALYIGSQLGPGPRDGLMTGLVRRSGRSVRLVRTSIEVGVVAVGWLLGGVVGVGTVLYALAIGPLVQAMLPWCVVGLDVEPGLESVVEPGPEPGMETGLETGLTGLETGE